MSGREESDNKLMFVVGETKHKNQEEGMDKQPSGGIDMMSYNVYFATHI